MATPQSTGDSHDADLFSIAQPSHGVDEERAGTGLIFRQECRCEKKTTSRAPTRSQFSILRQICNLIPPHLVPKLGRETGVDKKMRTFRAWSHVLSLLKSYGTAAGSFRFIATPQQSVSKGSKGPCGTATRQTAPP